MDPEQQDSRPQGPHGVYTSLEPWVAVASLTIVTLGFITALILTPPPPSTANTTTEAHR